MTQIKPFTVLLSLIFVVGFGTVFFRHVEGWNWLDSYFFTVVTISTVGYGELVPATDLGKIGTTALIFIGLGVFAIAIQQFALYNMRKREQETEWLIARLGHHDPDLTIEEEDDILTANEDDPPRTDMAADPDPDPKPHRNRPRNRYPHRDRNRPR
ncbi:MAG: potassium channel family protein [Pseudodonghicola sp.]|nr:potassium channel family protein [Pseudodonghicola sp.]